MEAGVLVRSGVMETMRVDVPSPTEPGFVLVRNVLSTICGSDTHAVYDTPVSDSHRSGYPGHESVGVVAESTDAAFAKSTRHSLPWHVG